MTNLLKEIDAELKKVWLKHASSMKVDLYEDISKLLQEVVKRVEDREIEKRAKLAEYWNEIVGVICQYVPEKSRREVYTKVRDMEIDAKLEIYRTSDLLSELNKEE